MVCGSTILFLQVDASMEADRDGMKHGRDGRSPKQSCLVTKLEYLEVTRDCIKAIMKNNPGGISNNITNYN